MALKYSTTVRTNRMSQLNADLGNSAVIKLVTGTRPANVAAPLTGNVVATFICNATTFGSVANGVLTANPIANTIANAAGVVTHFRAYKFDGSTGIIDGDVSTSGSDLNLDNNNIASGQTVSVTSFVITAAGA